MTDETTAGDSLDLPEWLRPFAVVAGLVALMWVVELIDLVPGTNFDRWGIRPRELRGLVGIVTAPLLHAGFGHLLGNTLPFLILGSVIAASGVTRYLEVTGIVMAISGLGLWLLGPSHSVNIGASALVFGYLAYLLARAVFERRIVYLLGGAVVLFLYGGVLWGLLPRPGISWQGHALGAGAGVIAARLLHAPKEKALPA